MLDKLDFVRTSITKLDTSHQHAHLGTDPIDWLPKAEDVAYPQCW